MNDSPRVIAVVDDEQPVRFAIGRLLQTAGFEVACCGGGGELLGLLALRHVDCVILDLHMPQIDGFEVLTRLTEARNLTPIAVLTGHDSPETRRRVLDAGVHVYLTKPVDRQTLLKAIDTAIAGSKYEKDRH